MVTLTNLIPNPSFETSASWSGIEYSTAQAKFGSRSCYLGTGTHVPTCPMIAPISGHKYYGRHYLKTNGTSSPADCRFEWFAGDGLGLNFVFGLNHGTWNEWGMESSILDIAVVNGTSFICRNFVVNNTAELWSDGLMIVDLTAAFGAGDEPGKEWCDANIPYFEGQITLEVFPLRTIDITSAAFAPNPAIINQSTALSVSVTETLRYLEPYYYYAGDLHAGEV